METKEPLSQLARAIGMPWWLFAVVSQALVILAPFVGLWGLRRWQSEVRASHSTGRWRPLPERYVLVGLPVVAGLFVTLCALYCLAWWPKPRTPRILEPDASILCWLYCGVFMTWPWAVAAMANGLAMIAAGPLLSRSDTRRIGGWLAVVSGLIAFRVGFLCWKPGTARNENPVRDVVPISYSHVAENML